MNRRLDKRIAKRQSFLDAAMEIVIEGGVGSLTIAKLAQAVDISVGGLYRYFPSKEAILVGLQEQALTEYGEELVRVVETVDAGLASVAPPPEIAAVVHIVVVFITYLEDAEAAPARHRLLDEFMSAPVPLLDDDQALVVERALTPVVQFCARTLEEAARVEAIAPGDAVQRTHVIWAVLHGLDHFRKRDRLQPERLRVAALVPHAFRALLVGWGATPECVEAALDLWLQLRDMA